eukprot:1142063-Pyramimonas_sp.AAC.1
MPRREPAPEKKQSGSLETDVGWISMRGIIWTEVRGVCFFLGLLERPPVPPLYPHRPSSQHAYTSRGLGTDFSRGQGDYLPADLGAESWCRPSPSGGRPLALAHSNRESG